jgi:uncharacterized protein YecE (DUF72 family)
MPRPGLPASRPAGEAFLQRLSGDTGQSSQRAGVGKTPRPQAGSWAPQIEAGRREVARNPRRRLKPVRIGCSGWNYRDWRECFYPKGTPPARWLEHYATIFDTVEVNSTFYRLASAAAVGNWVEATPERFLFSLKASRYLTHVRRLRDMGRGVRRFYAPLGPIIEAGRLGPILWQLPESFHRDDEALSFALERLPEGRHCFEFRHPSWFDEAIFELLRERGVALVIGDHPERPFQSLELTADWTFIRFHYGRRGRDGNYSRTELEEWKRRIAAWRSRVEVLAYFNNDWRAFAPANARWLAQRLSK